MAPALCCCGRGHAEQDVGRKTGVERGRPTIARADPDTTGAARPHNGAEPTVDADEPLPEEHKLVPTGDAVLDEIVVRRRKAALAKLSELRALYEPATLSPEQALFCTDATLLRYLEARDGDVKKAADMMDASLKWRKEHIDGREVHCPHCRRDPNSHCFFPIGKDKRGWTMIYSCAGRAADKTPPTSMVHMSMMLEEIYANNSAPGKIVWIIDMHGFGWRDMDSRMGKTAIPMFSDHYPERMGQIVLIDPPAVLKGIVEMVMPLLDPVTQRKVKLLRADKYDYFRAHCATQAQLAFITAVLDTKAEPGSFPEEETARVRSAASAELQIPPPLMHRNTQSAAAAQTERSTSGHV